MAVNFNSGVTDINKKELRAGDKIKFRKGYLADVHFGSYAADDGSKGIGYYLSIWGKEVDKDVFGDDDRPTGEVKTSTVMLPSIRIEPLINDPGLGAEVLAIEKPKNAKADSKAK